MEEPGEGGGVEAPAGPTAELAEWTGRKHKVTSSGKDSYYVREDGSRVLWPDTKNKKAVVEAQFWYEKLKGTQITGDEYRAHLDRLFAKADKGSAQADTPQGGYRKAGSLRPTYPRRGIPKRPSVT